MKRQATKPTKPRKYKLRVQRWDNDSSAADEHKEEKEERQPAFVSAASAGRCVYVNERTLRGMRLTEHDIVVLSSSILPASPATPSNTSICRVEVSASVLAHHIFVPPTLVYRHRLRFHQPVYIAPVHPQLAALSTKHIRSLHIQPLSRPPTTSSALRLPAAVVASVPSASALSNALLSVVHAHKQWPLAVEAEGSVLELQVDGKPQWAQLTVNADIKQRTATTATATSTERAEQKRKEDEDRHQPSPPSNQPKLSVSLSTPLTYYLLSDPQQLQPSVASSKLPPLPLPLPVVQSAVAATVGLSAAPATPSHVLSDIGGLSSFISLCLSHLLSFYPRLPSSASQPTSSLPASAGLMLSGSASSGKSLVTSALAYHLYLTHSIHPVVLVQQPRERPEDAVRRCLREAGQYAPSLLIIDDIDVLLPAATGDESGWESQASAAVVCELLEAAVQAGGVAVLAATSSATSHHARLCSALLFPCVMDMPVLAVEERAEVLEAAMTKRGVVAIGGREMRRRLCERMDGYKGRDVSQVVSRAIHAAISRRTQSTQHLEQTNDEPLLLTSADFNNALLGFVPVSLAKLAPVSSAVAWEDIGGLADVKQTLVDTLQLPTQYAPLFDALPIKLRSGVLLYGGPGCGKTLLATAVAAYARLHLLAVKGPELLNKYIGSSEQAVRAVFEQARAAAPCLLFFDEMEAIATKRGGESTGVTDRVVNQFLCELDGVEGGAAGQGGAGSGRVYVLAASSRPDLLDAALLRPGRIDKSLYVGFPTADERADILRRLLLRERGGRELDDEWAACVQAIAAEADGYSGADLNGLLTDARTASLTEYVERANNGGQASDGDTPAGELTVDRLWTAFQASHASVSDRERKDFERLYARFIAAKEGNTTEQFDPQAKLRTTQA